jgi:outer membrane protein assembly factor BamB
MGERGRRIGIAAAGWLAAVAVALVNAAAAVDWPQWRGPDRTAVTAEPSGYPAGWPPARLWEANVGKGCTSPIVAGGRVYVMGWHGEADTLRCLDARTGAEAWKQSYRARYQGRQRTGDESAYGGPSSTPTLDAETGWLYTLGVDGDLRCWDTRREGKGVWNLNLYEAFQVPQRENVGPPDGRGHRDYGFTSGPLVLGDLVIVEVGAKEGTVVAFDKRTGRPRWRSEYADCAGHTGGPALLTVQGMPCLVTLALKDVVVMRTDAGHEGRTVAAFPWATDFANNIATPAVAGGRLVVTSAYNQSRTALLEVAPGGMRERWSVRDHAGVASPVVHKGCAYLVDAALVCLDLETGKRLWKGGALGHGTCLVTGDGKVLVFGNGKLVLAEAGPAAKAYRELARVDDLVPATCYPHVALADGMVACKDMDGNLVMLSVRPGDRKAAGLPEPRP